MKNMRRHNGSIVSMKKGLITKGSGEQNKFSRCSTGGELSTADGMLSRVEWTKKFIECQNFNVKLNILFKDDTRNTSLL